MSLKCDLACEKRGWPLFCLDCSGIPCKFVWIEFQRRLLPGHVMTKALLYCVQTRLFQGSVHAAFGDASLYQLFAGWRTGRNSFFRTRLKGLTDMNRTWTEVRSRNIAQPSTGASIVIFMLNSSLCTTNMQIATNGQWCMSFCLHVLLCWFSWWL